MPGPGPDADERPAIELISASRRDGDTGLDRRSEWAAADLGASPARVVRPITLVSTHERWAGRAVIRRVRGGV